MKSSSLNSGPEGKIRKSFPSVPLVRYGFSMVFSFASKAKVAGKLMDKAWNQDEEQRGTQLTVTVM